MFYLKQNVQSLIYHTMTSQYLIGILHIHTGVMFYFSTYSAGLFCLTFQKAALNCTTVGWGSCTLIGVAMDSKEMILSPLEILMGRTVNGTFFGGQFFSFNILHSNTQILKINVIERKEK